MIVWIKRIMLVALCLAMAAAVAYAFVPKPVEVDLAPVVRGPLQVTIDEDGKTRIKERYVVYTPLAGRVRRIELKPGDSVTAGETVLALIEPSDPGLLDARAQAEALARVRAAEAARARTEPALEAARAALEFAENEHNRAIRLSERNAIARHELESAALLERTRTQELRAAQFAQEIAQFELELAQAALARSAPGEETGDGAPVDWQFPIPSPITGRVLRVFQESATVVTAGARLVELGDPADLEVEIDVLSSDAVRIQPGNKVILEHWGGSHPLTAEVRLVEPAAFTKISALGVEEQRVNVVADFVDPQEVRTTLGDAFRVEARIVIWEQPDVLKVPASALFRQGDDWAVFEMGDGAAALRRVKIGRRNALEAEVLSGLSEGDRVVVHPNDQISDGTALLAR